ncbi:MAG: glutamate racemase [Candidatus Omnitrophica bacterium 4484_49]|nr:glutamate racemase [Candidatus Omnitrophota bacterium]OQX83595.1 MAG: glutamate racemase [Candidatus Omnitrophica bacterium 4484_49]
MNGITYSPQDLQDKSRLPIGVFDSGVGGLTIVKEIMDFLPQESVIYLGDTARVPYGTKSQPTVLKFTTQAIEFFNTRGIKMLLIACNTSSSLALPYLKDGLDFPVYGVIDPGVSEALNVTRIGRIGVIGTRATISSRIYEMRLKQQRGEVEVFSYPCPLFVPLIEEGWIDDPVTYKVAKRYLDNFKRHGIDTLILGCTHYPLIKNVIRQVIGKHVALVDSARTLVREIKNKLKILNLENKGGSLRYEFYVSDEPEQFKKLGSFFLGREIKSVKRVELEEYKGCMK